MLGLFRCLVPVLLTVSLLGCAVLRPQPGPETQPSGLSATNLPEGEGWWYARFHIHRPAGKAPQWHIGTLLAGEIVAPVFDSHYSDVLIWRVHRRAADDDVGHVFSFIFYSTAAGAQRIYSAIDNNTVLSQLRKDGLVTRVGYDDVRRITRPDIGDTSDENWPPVIRQTWPALIMGASRMWLDTVAVLAEKQSQDSGLEQRYQAVDQEISRLWAEQGQHAILHHLSAIYAYQPLLIRY